MRQFLLGKMSIDLMETNPHSLIHGGIQGYSFTSSEGMYIFANLLGIFIVTIIKPVKHEKWKNTFVKNESGRIKSPQRVASPIFNELKYLNKQKQKQNGINNISERQKHNIIEKIKKDPQAFKDSESYKRIEEDKNIKSID
jgi:hypothetical protein